MHLWGDGMSLGLVYKNGEHIFGRSLDVIVQEGIQAKLSMMPDTIRYKLGQTLTKVINKGSNNMIAIVL